MSGLMFMGLKHDKTMGEYWKDYKFTISMLVGIIVFMLSEKKP
jgi:hypothetical protein